MFTVMPNSLSRSGVTLSCTCALFGSSYLYWAVTEPTGSLGGPYVYVWIFNKVFELHKMCFICEVYQYRFLKGLLGVRCDWVYTPFTQKTMWNNQSDRIFRLPSVVTVLCIYVTHLNFMQFWLFLPANELKMSDVMSAKAAFLNPFKCVRVSVPLGYFQVLGSKPRLWFSLWALRGVLSVILGMRMCHFMANSYYIPLQYLGEVGVPAL